MLHPQHKYARWICIIVLFSTWKNIAGLPCNSTFRALFPQLFTHCQDCIYGSTIREETGVLKNATIVVHLGKPWNSKLQAIDMDINVKTILLSYLNVSIFNTKL